MPSSTFSMSLFIQWIFGSLVVLLYALDRFETPVPARGTTTLMRYYVARTGYLISMFLLFLLLAGAFTDVGPIIELLAGASQEAVEQDLKELPGPLLSALLLTSLLPHIPYLKRIDELVKHWFQRIGNIPLEARALSGQLQHTRVTITPELMLILQDTLDELGIEKDWVSSRENTFRHRWARIAALYASVLQWHRTQPYIAYMGEHHAQFDDISRRVQAIRELDEHTVATLNQEAGSPHSWRKRLFADLGVLHESLCDFIAGGLLQGGWSPKQRQMLLTRLGFEAAAQPVPRLSAHDVVLVGGIIFLTMLFMSLLVNQNLQGTDLADNINMRVLFMVPIIYCVAIVAAIYPKAFWPFADIRVVGYRPVMGYVASGALAASVTFLIQLLFRYVQGGFAGMIAHGSFTHAFITNLDRWPWVLMNFLMTVAIAWAADNHALSREKEPGWLRISETLGLASVCGLLQWMTLQLLLIFSNDPARWTGKVDHMILTSVLIGGVIGFIIPHYYRARGNGDASLYNERPPARSVPDTQWVTAEMDKPG